MKKYCFHPPKNIIVGTLAAILWVAVFPFWLLGESTPLNALVSGDHPREVGRNADFHHADPPADDSDPLPPGKAPKTAADADAALPALDRIVLLLRQSRRGNECLGRADRIVGFGAV